MDGEKTSLIITIVVALISAVLSFISSYAIFCIKNKHSKKEKANDEQKEKIEALTAENSDLKNKLAYFEEVSKAPNGDYLIHGSPGNDICPKCWNEGRKLSYIFSNNAGKYKCPNCGMIGVYNHQQAVEHEKHMLDTISRSNMKSASFFKN